MMRPLAALLLIDALAFSGCGDSEDPTGPIIDQHEYQPAVSPEALLQVFVEIYEERDLNAYDDLLDPRFRFSFLDEGFSWEKPEDLASTDNLFSGEARTNSQGQLTRAISAIAVDRMLLTEGWTDVPAEHPSFGQVPGARTALYSHMIVFTHPAGTITLSGRQRFFAAPTVTGSDTLWSLLGQEDIPFKSSEQTSWSDLKALYR